MFEILYSKGAKKFLKKSDKFLVKRLFERIGRLKDNPVPNDAKFIRRDCGEKVFRYRIGNYKVLYKIKENEKIILVTKIDKRERIYN